MTKRGRTWFLDLVYGDDENDGLTPETAVLTHERLAQVVNENAYAPSGDVIIHMPGDGTERVAYCPEEARQ